jgi:nitrous oxidase accessory protein NosD
VLRTSAIGFDVRSSNVTIGRRNHGFTLASTSLPFAVAGAGLLDGVRIAGNVLALDGPDAPAGILAIGTRGARFEDNRIDAPRGCGVGIYLQDSGGVVANNAIFGCSKGVQVELGVSMRLVHNTVAGNVRSGAAGKGAGFDLQGDIAEVSGNVVLGNGTGVIVRTTPIASFRNNAFIASTTNCGVQNLSDGTLVAAGNYWGAASGPGADPADAACGIAAATSVVTTPFLGSDPTQAQVALR